MQIARRMAAVTVVLSLLTASAAQAAATSSANRLALSPSLVSTISVPSGARAGARHGKSNHLLGLPFLLIVAAAAAATAVVVVASAKAEPDSP